MYQVQNSNINVNCDLFTLCKCIYAKFEDFKNYILNLLKNENSQMIEQYSVYYNALFDILGLFDEFKNEYRALLKTNRIIKYIFNNKKLTPELKRFVQNVWKSFSDLLNFKLTMLENNNSSNEDYEKACLKFDDELAQHREYFYSEIYVQTHEFDEEIDQIVSILF